MKQKLQILFRSRGYFTAHQVRHPSTDHVAYTTPQRSNKLQITRSGNKTQRIGTVKDIKTCDKNVRKADILINKINELH